MSVSADFAELIAEKLDATQIYFHLCFPSLCLYTLLDSSRMAVEQSRILNKLKLTINYLFLIFYVRYVYVAYGVVMRSVASVCVSVLFSL